MKKCGHRYGVTHGNCPSCRAAYARKWRKSNPPTAADRERQRVSALARRAVKAGKIARQDCQRCGDPASQMVLVNYREPLKIAWLCRLCRTVFRTMQRRQKVDSSYGLTLTRLKGMGY